MSGLVRPMSYDVPLLYFGTTSLLSRASSGTSKFLRLTTERIVIGNCEDEDSLNYVQKNFMCINEASTEAVAFRTVSALILGFTSTLVFSGNPLFAIFDGLNAALYDATEELKKVAERTENQELSMVIEHINAHKGLLFEGLTGYLKLKENPQKFAQEYYGFLKGGLIDIFAAPIGQTFFPNLVNMRPDPNVNNVNITRIDVSKEFINKTPVFEVNTENFDFLGDVTRMRDEL
jgi:hypothetical protein